MPNGFRTHLPLLKHVQSVSVAFNPFMSTSGSVRSVISPLMSENARKINDKLKFSSDVGTHVKEPVMDVKYTDGKQIQLKTAALTFDQLEQSLFKHASILQSKEEQ